MSGDPARQRGRPSASFAPERRRPLHHAWPEPDRSAWERALAPAAGPFDEPGAASTLAPASRRVREQGWGSFLAFLEQQGRLLPVVSPVDRLTPENVAHWFAGVRARVSAKTADQLLVNLTLAANAMHPGIDLRWIRQLAIRPTRSEIRASRLPRPEPPEGGQLVAAALGLCAEADEMPPSVMAALLHRNGLLLALATFHGLRLANLAEIELGRHLIQTGLDSWRLRFERTKVRKPLDVALAAGLVPHLQRHLATHRPLLLGDAPDEHHRLWVGRDGRPLNATAFRSVFQSTGRRLLGRPLHPHAVRHVMATTLLARNPRALGTAAAALGHAGPLSVNQVYDRSGRGAAEAEWQAMVRKLRGRQR